MGPSKRHQRTSKPPPPTRSRTTRSSKGRILLCDPAKNNQLLTEQLRSLGLYAASTLGDGNCLFRALSDQLHGTPSHHLQLRAEICDWIEAHKQRYEPFCEDERGLPTHLRCMREQGTYGGHLELSAFAHLTQRNVKVIQPGLVYVIEWAAGGDAAPSATDNTSTDEDAKLDDREKRRLRRDQKRAEKQKHDETADHDLLANPSAGAVYVAYHDWEHFSSIRNLNGPHSGFPCVVETPADPDALPPVKLKPTPRTKPKADSKNTSKRLSKNKPTKSTLDPPAPDPKDPPTPSQIPLPGSRSPSPTEPVFRADISPPTPYLTQSPSHPFSAVPSTTPGTNLRVHRSPKRSFDESSGSSASSESVAKRTRSSRLTVRAAPAAAADRMNVDDELIDLDSTPGLSAPGSSSGSSAASSPASSPLPTTPPAPTPPPEQEPSRPLTRRQRKALGLPKPRSALLAKRAGAGKIVIPGGKYKKTASGKGQVSVREADDDDEDDDEKAEWRTNGTGRVDVRGFRELKI